MNRKEVKIDASRNAMIFELNGAEVQGWCRTFPMQLPVGMILRHEWDGTGLSLKVWYEPINKPSAEKQTEKASSERAKLERMSLEQLETAAAENGVPIPWPSGATKNQKLQARPGMIEALLKKVAPVDGIVPDTKS